MNLVLDAQTEQRIQRELDRGHFHNPAEVIARALDLLEAEQTWLESNRDAINDRLNISFDEAERGESYSPHEARTLLKNHRASRSA